jgi:hypothetical protein
MGRVGTLGILHDASVVVAGGGMCKLSVLANTQASCAYARFGDAHPQGIFATPLAGPTIVGV